MTLADPWLGNPDLRLPARLSYGHSSKCAFYLAETCSVPIACDHGFDVCPTCDACDCNLRSHEPPRNSGEGTAVNGPMPLAGGDESQTSEPE